MDCLTPRYSLAFHDRGGHHQQATVFDEQQGLLLDGEGHLRTVFRDEPLLKGIRFAPWQVPRGFIEVTNASNQPLMIEGHRIEPRGSVRTPLPSALRWGDYDAVVFEPLEPSTLQRDCRRLSNRLRAPVGSHTASFAGDHLSTSVGHSPAPETLKRWFSALANLQREASGTDRFYQRVVEAVVNPGGLDAAMLIERDRQFWRIRCSHLATPPVGMTFEPALVDLAERQRNLILYSGGSRNRSAIALAAPIFDDHWNVTAILYASRHISEANRRASIRELEALWVQLLTETVTTGNIRHFQQAETASHRALLEQSYPSEVVRLLCLNRSVDLPVEERQVSMLFADLIDSCSFCEQHSSQVLFDYLSDVMDLMTAVIERNGGTVVDYCGDGLVAMWNAPQDQVDHAQRACQAGLEIQEELKVLGHRWRDRLGESRRFGIGIHSGQALVGNAGSRQKLKYGPRGPSVNLADRVEKATRPLAQPILISDATRRQLGSEVSAYRLGRFKLRGIGEPCVLHALFSLEAEPRPNECCVAKHFEVLDLIQQREFSAAADLLDCCQGCALDELSLQFLRQQLAALSIADQTMDEGSEPIFDLSNPTEASP